MRQDILFAEPTRLMCFALFMAMPLARDVENWCAPRKTQDAGLPSDAHPKWPFAMAPFSIPPGLRPMEEVRWGTCGPIQPFVYFDFNVAFRNLPVRQSPDRPARRDARRSSTSGHCGASRLRQNLPGDPCAK